MEAGATDDQRSLVLVVQPLEHSPSFPLELRNAERQVGIDQIDHVVGNPNPVDGRGLGGADIHPPVHLHGVDRNDLGVEFLGQTKGEITLSGGGRSEERQYSAQSTVPRR